MKHKELLQNGYEIESHGWIGNTEKWHNLTASCHELRIFTHGMVDRIIVDMGGYQGPGKINRSLEDILSNNNDWWKNVKNMVITHGHMDHIGDLLHTTKSNIETIIATPETKKIIKIALTDAIKIAETEYEIKKHNFESYIKKTLSPAVKIVQEYENGGIKRNSKWDRMLTSTQEHERKEIFLEAQKILEKEGVDAFDKNWRRKLTAPKKPEFNMDDLDILLEKIKTHRMEDWWHEIIPNKVSMCYFNAGHVMGSASPLFCITDEKEQKHYVHFSGDIGSFHGSIAPAWLPTPPSQFPIETILIESTYWWKVREDFSENLKKYEAELTQDIKKYKRIIQACFSLDRLQKILYYTIDMKKRGLIPNHIPILVDSKMWVEYIKPYIQSAKKQLQESEQKQIPNQLHTYTENLEHFIEYLDPENKEYEVLDKENRDLILDALEWKHIVITASWMADGGPIMEYLKRYGNSEKSVFYFPGFLVPWTTGHNIANNESQLKVANIDWQPIEIQAKMSQKQGFSGHGDERDLVKYLSSLRLASDSSIIINHGDTQRSSLALAHTLKRKWFPQKCIIPELNEIFVKNFDK